MMEKEYLDGVDSEAQAETDGESPMIEQGDEFIKILSTKDLSSFTLPPAYGAKRLRTCSGKDCPPWEKAVWRQTINLKTQEVIESRDVRELSNREL